MSAEIFQFSTAPRRAEKIKTSTRVGEDIGDNLSAETVFGRTGRPLLPAATETAKNSRLRNARKEAWWHAGRVADYWRARIDWCSALTLAQKNGIADSASFPTADYHDRFPMLDKWREAVAKQLITPAPDLRAIEWKRAKLESREFPHLPIKKERVERAIADDVAFLAAHPTRTQRGSS